MRRRVRSPPLGCRSGRRRFGRELAAYADLRWLSIHTGQPGFFPQIWLFVVRLSSIAIFAASCGGTYASRSRLGQSRLRWGGGRPPVAASPS